MKVEYKDLKLNPRQKALLIRTIQQNPYIPVTPYKLQLYSIADENKRKLIGGSAYSGKSILGAMLALQYIEVPNYRCLIIRRTYDDVIATGGIVDYLKEWTEPFQNIVHNESKKVFINLENNAKIFYNYAMYDDDKNKFKSRQYHRIIVDEASEIVKTVLQFLNRSLRYNEEKRIPLNLFYISNPASSTGIEYLKNRFVEDNAPYPYFEMNFWDNPFVDEKDYRETLSELSKADYQYQMGNWEYTLQSGDVFDNDMIIQATITPEKYNQIREEEELIKVVRGWDLAASEKKTSDYTVGTLTEYYTGNIRVTTGQHSFKLKPGRLEERMKAIMDQDGDNVEQVIELQVAAAGLIVQNLWEEIFRDYRIDWSRSTKTKVIRAGSIVPGLNRGEILLLENKDNPYIKMFTKQAVNFPNYDNLTDDDPEAKHDDRIDSFVISNTHESRAIVSVV